MIYAVVLYERALYVLHVNRCDCVSRVTRHVIRVFPGMEVNSEINRYCEVTKVSGTDPQ